nr:hypothetical protein Iba_chr06bCG8940 [Ipomoea batatas]
MIHVMNKRAETDTMSEGGLKARLHKAGGASKPSMLIDANRSPDCFSLQKFLTDFHRCLTLLYESPSKGIGCSVDAAPSEANFSRRSRSSLLT